MKNNRILVSKQTKALKSVANRHLGRPLKRWHEIVRDHMA